MLELKGLKFHQTCSACPEQYDVYDAQDNRVGYIRFRWGYLRCEYPGYGGQEIYGVDVGDEWSGCFKSESQRMYHLNAIADKILEKLND